jgi:hypothetical protein
MSAWLDQVNELLALTAKFANQMIALVIVVQKSMSYRLYIKTSAYGTNVPN